MARKNESPQKAAMREMMRGSAYSLFGRNTSGKNVNERTAMQTTAAYSCVRILVAAIVSLPIHVYHYTKTGKERVYNHPLYYLLPFVIVRFISLRLYA